MTGDAPRVIVVLGYSDGGRGELHPDREQRGSRGPPRSPPSDDVVVLSGWARVPGTRSEAELMAAAWQGRARELVVDPDARTTVGNAMNALNDIRRVGAREVVVVTSRWHAPRAKAAFRLLLCRARHEGHRSVSTGPREVRASCGSCRCGHFSPLNSGTRGNPGKPGDVRPNRPAGRPLQDRAKRAESDRPTPDRLRVGESAIRFSIADSPTPPRHECGSSSRAEGPPPRPEPARRGSPRGSRAPSPPACPPRCRGRTGP